MASQIRQRATRLCRGFYNSRCFTSLTEITSSSMSSEAQAQTCCRNAESGLYGLERFSRREFGQEATKAPRKMYEYLHVRKKTGFVEKNPCITFVLGGPGSGKGTQCAKIVEMFGFAHLSAGDLLRREIINDSENGTMIRKMITEGKIVPSEVTVKLIQRAMESNENDKFLIDGFPRSDENRVAFEHIIGAEPDIVLFLDCPEEDMVKRVLSRNQGRIDDNIETIRLRLKVFAELNLPVINYYSEKGKVHKINAVGTVEEVFERIQPHFDAYTVIK